jgi:hypothetical protein
MLLETFMHALFHSSRLHYQDVVFNNIRSWHAGVIELLCTQAGVLRRVANFDQAWHAHVGNYVDPASDTHGLYRAFTRLKWTPEREPYLSDPEWLHGTANSIFKVLGKC